MSKVYLDMPLHVILTHPTPELVVVFFTKPHLQHRLPCSTVKHSTRMSHCINEQQNKTASESATEKLAADV